MGGCSMRLYDITVFMATSRTRCSPLTPMIDNLEVWINKSDVFKDAPGGQAYTMLWPDKTASTPKVGEQLPCYCGSLSRRPPPENWSQGLHIMSQDRNLGVQWARLSQS